jgi:hypothetical protein
MIYGERVSNRTAEVDVILKLMASRGIRTDWAVVDGLETGAIIFQHADDRVAPVIVINRTGYELITEDEYLHQGEREPR